MNKRSNKESEKIYRIYIRYKIKGTVIIENNLLATYNDKEEAERIKEKLNKRHQEERGLYFYIKEGRLNLSYQELNHFISTNF